MIKTTDHTREIKLFKKYTFLGGAASQTLLPSHEMQGTFLNCRVSVDLVFARALNNEAR